MKNRYCYWSVVDGPYTDMMSAVVKSARQAGVFTPFHIWSDRPIESSTHHPLKALDKTLYLFKLRFLQEEVAKLNYDYFVWLDADTYFVRKPKDVLGVLQGSPIHASLESDACAPNNIRPDWWGCPLQHYAALMRGRGVCNRAIYNVNAGFWIVHRDVIETVFALAMDFWAFCRANGHNFTEEPPLAYAAHMLCGDVSLHTLRATCDLWASDWTGFFANRLPDGQPWWFIDYFSGEKIPVNPAIVHAMRSKDALVAASSHPFHPSNA
jgi:hypothetical protein